MLLKVVHNGWSNEAANSGKNRVFTKRAGELVSWPTD